MAGTYTDPVCGMEVTPENAVAASDYQGTTYYFCSMECKNTFEMDPQPFVDRQRPGSQV